MIERFYTKDDEDVDYDWAERDVLITNEQGETIYEQVGVEAPASWSDAAVNIVASKYFYGQGSVREKSVKVLIERVVAKITEEGLAAGYFTGEEDNIFEDELTHILTKQIASFNSPVWFNIGVPGRRQQPSACFINSIEDSMDSILELAQIEGKIFQYGSGAGVNLSPLRAEGESLSGGGCSSGPISFMKGFDSFAGAIKSGGTTRRAAKMVILDADHPDIEDFIDCKTHEELKAHALIREGYDERYDGEAYGSIFFQNANHTVRVDNKFMEACEDGKTYQLKGRSDSCLDRKIDASDLLIKIAQRAWETGDPGIQFRDTINDWHTTPHIDAINASNPCSEYLFLDNTSCNLSSLRLTAFFDKDGGEFDWGSLHHTVRVMALAMDILIEFGEYPHEKIKEGTQASRTLGIGFSDLGALLMYAGIPYGSKEGRMFASAIMAHITYSGYDMSADIAAHLSEAGLVDFAGRAIGPFDYYNGGCMNAVLAKHKIAWDVLDPDLEHKWMNGHLNVDFGALIGRPMRNAQMTVIAPTGTISFMMDCESTGVEPIMAPVQYKKLVGGGTIEITPQCIKYAAHKFKTSDEPWEIERSLSHDVDILVAENPIFATSLGRNKLAPLDHLKMVAALQPFVSGAISKTINLPTDATVDDILDIYKRAHTYGVKCVTVYRDGCKLSQPLNVTKDEVKPEPVVGRVKLPKTRHSLTHKFAIGGHDGYLTVGLYEDGRPGELFLKMSKQGSTISGLLDAWALAISIMLQYGVPIDEVIAKFRHSRYEPSGFTGDSDIPTATSVTDYVSQWLTTEFMGAGISNTNVGETDLDPHPVAQTSGNACRVCGALMVMSGTCQSCPSCGEAGGCG